MLKTKKLANEILNSIQFTVDAHIDRPKTQNDAVRFGDKV